MGNKKQKKMKYFSLIISMVQAAPGVTTHVLDTTIGLPGQGVKVNVYKQHANRPLSEDRWDWISTVYTNSDGRTDEPVISQDHFFKLEFDLAGYYKQETFFPQASLTFKVKQDQAMEHFHVPILCTPYSYSTYRGS